MLFLDQDEIEVARGQKWPIFPKAAGANKIPLNTSWDAPVASFFRFDVSSMKRPPEVNKEKRQEDRMSIWGGSFYLRTTFDLTNKCKGFWHHGVSLKARRSIRITVLKCKSLFWPQGKFIWWAQYNQYKWVVMHRYKQMRLAGTVTMRLFLCL